MNTLSLSNGIKSVSDEKNSKQICFNLRLMGKFQSAVEISSQVFKVQKYIICVIGKTNNTEVILLFRYSFFQIDSYIKRLFGKKVYNTLLNVQVQPRVQEDLSTNCLCVIMLPFKMVHIISIKLLSHCIKSRDYLHQ